MSDTEIAVKMIWTALQMKPEYTTAALCIARIFCADKGIDDLVIERAILRVSAHRNGTGSYEDAVSAATADLQAERDES